MIKLKKSPVPVASRLDALAAEYLETAEEIKRLEALQSDRKSALVKLAGKLTLEDPSHVLSGRKYTVQVTKQYNAPGIDTEKFARNFPALWAKCCRKETVFVPEMLKDLCDHNKVTQEVLSAISAPRTERSIRVTVGLKE